MAHVELLDVDRVADRADDPRIDAVRDQVAGDAVGVREPPVDSAQQALLEPLGRAELLRLMVVAVAPKRDALEPQLRQHEQDVIEHLLVALLNDHEVRIADDRPCVLDHDTIVPQVEAWDLDADRRLELDRIASRELSLRW